MVGWTLGNKPLPFRGLSQSSISFAVPLGLTSTIFASKLVAHNNLRYRSISPLVAAIGAGLAVGTLFSDVSLSPAYRDHSATATDSFGHKVVKNRFTTLSRARTLHFLGLGTSDAGLFPPLGHNILRHQGHGAKNSARMHPNPTASRSRATSSFAASDGRRSSLRSSCPPGKCTANGHRHHRASRRNGSGRAERNAGGSGSGSGGQFPLKVVEKHKDGMFSREYRILGRRGYEEPPPPPPPPPPPTLEDDDGDPRSGKGSLFAFFATAAVCGVLARIVIKRRRIPYGAVRRCVPTAKSHSQKPRYTFGVPDAASLNIPLDCGPDGPCILEDYMIERSDIAPFSSPIVVEYAACPPGYADVRFEDFEPHQMLSGSKLDSRPAMRSRPAFLDLRNFLKDVALSQFKFLKFGLLNLAVVMGALLSLSFIATLYQSYRYREKHDKPYGEPPVGPCTDIKCTEGQHSDGQSNADALDGSSTIEEPAVENPVEAYADQDNEVVVAVENSANLELHNDRHVDLGIQAEDEAPSLTLVHAVVPVVEKQEWCLDFDKFGHPLFESTMVNIDALGICATESFYQEDASFNLEEALGHLKFYFAENSSPPPQIMINTIEHETEAELSLSISSVNIDDIHATFDEEVVPPMKLDIEKHQTEMDTYISESSFNIDDIYVPFEEDPENNFPPYDAQTACFVDIGPLTEVAVAAIGFDAPVGDATMDTSHAQTDDGLEAIEDTRQDDPLRCPTPDLPSPVYTLNPFAESFVPGLFLLEAPNIDNTFASDNGKEEKGYRRRRKRPKKKNTAEATCSEATASTSA